MRKLNNYSQHTIIFIKDMKNNKFLVYYDKDWDCYLFPNTPGIELKPKYIKDFIINMLNIYNEQINNIQHLGFLIHEKEKFPEKIKKWYYHDFVSVNIINFNENETGSCFGRKFKEYRWMSLDEMKSNGKIMERNKDVIDYLEMISSEF